MSDFDELGQMMIVAAVEAILVPDHPPWPYRICAVSIAAALRVLVEDAQQRDAIAISVPTLSLLATVIEDQS